MDWSTIVDVIQQNSRMRELQVISNMTWNHQDTMRKTCHFGSRVTDGHRCSSKWGCTRCTPILCVSQVTLIQDNRFETINRLSLSHETCSSDGETVVLASRDRRMWLVTDCPLDSTIAASIKTSYSEDDFSLNEEEIHYLQVVSLKKSYITILLSNNDENLSVWMREWMKDSHWWFVS